MAKYFGTLVFALSLTLSATPADSTKVSAPAQDAPVVASRNDSSLKKSQGTIFGNKQSSPSSWSKIKDLFM